ncbi:ribonuclease E/G, partial [bacterium]|nr:ribonuclease E/G [bacterium]
TLASDIQNLYSLWRRIEEKSRRVTAPALIYKEVSLASSVIRDLFSPEISKLIVDRKKLYKEISSYISSVAPQLVDRVEYFKGPEPVFDHYNIETEIEKGIRRKVWLDGGGYIIIEHTEAMVTIDVNSGRFKGKQDHEANSLNVNLKSTREICRQLRLRDIGGIIVIDYIDLWEERNRKKVFDEIRKELKKDRAKVDVAPIGPFGLMVLTRQRIKPSLLFTFKEPCTACHGTGMVASRETVTTELERWMARFHNRSGERRLRLHVHPELKEFLTEGGLLNRINRIMLQHKMFIRLITDSSIPPNEFKAYSVKTDEDVTKEYRT